MKRYAGRRAKPPLSQWCAGRGGMGSIWAPGMSRPRPVYISGHEMCRAARWHSPGHLDCCGSPEEQESYACQCPCHPAGPPRFSGRG